MTDGIRIRPREFDLLGHDMYLLDILDRPDFSYWPAKADSYIRSVEVQPDGTNVLRYTGGEVFYQDATGAITDGTTYYLRPTSNEIKFYPTVEDAIAGTNAYQDGSNIVPFALIGLAAALCLAWCVLFLNRVKR